MQHVLLIMSLCSRFLIKSASFCLYVCRYISLRLDGRVRGSGIGYPPWNAFVAQLPPVKGMWSGLLDGFDGRV